MHLRKILGIIILSIFISENVYAWWSVQLIIKDSMC